MLVTWKQISRRCRESKTTGTLSLGKCAPLLLSETYAICSWSRPLVSSPVVKKMLLSVMFCALADAAGWMAKDSSYKVWDSGPKNHSTKEADIVSVFELFSPACVLFLLEPAWNLGAWGLMCLCRALVFNGYVSLRTQLPSCPTHCLRSAWAIFRTGLRPALC